MKLPRDISGIILAKKLEKFGYAITRQTGSHLRLTTERNGLHHITIPLHSPLKTGTFSSILLAVASHHKLSKQEVISFLF